MGEQLDITRILYRDGDCLVVNKAVGEAMEGPGAGMVDLPALLAPVCGGANPWPVHRIDVPVTGCALFALNPIALADLNKAFADGKAIKTYWAIVELPEDGKEIPKEAELRHWILVDGKRNKALAYDVGGTDRYEARMRYRLVGKGDRYAFLEIDLITGRHHQIRAQLAAVGLHIKGDLKYGARRSEKSGGIRLHARALSFPCPSKPASFVSVTAPVPERDPLWLAFEKARGEAT